MSIKTLPKSFTNPIKSTVSSDIGNKQPHQNTVDNKRIIVFSFLLIMGMTMLVGCGGDPSNKVLDVVTELPTETPTPTITPTPIPTEKPTRSLDEVAATFGNEENLDSKHVDLDCETCHQHEDEVVILPPDSNCFVCHGGSYGGITELTSMYLPFNPHDYHYTTGVTCGFCHEMHEPLESSCGFCHNDKAIYKPGNE
jgi:hypothetical protein